MKNEIRIKGQKMLNGSVRIDGSKNLIVSLIPASLLSKGRVVFHNVPLISDVFLLIDILEKLNVKTTLQDKTLSIDATNIIYQDLLYDEIKEFRASYYFIGVMLGLFGKLKIYHPGGCDFGKRPIDYHLASLKQLGVEIDEDEIIDLKFNNIKENIVEFNVSSVGATINLLLFASTIENEIKIINGAIEPEIIELIKFLRLIGVNIIVDNRTFIIKGKRKLNGAEFSVIPDRIEAGTYALLGASVGDNISISPVIKEHLESLFEIFDILEVPYEYSNHVLNISRCNINKGILIETKPYPGFPTDLQQPLTAFLTQLNATSVIIETIYENRFAHIPMLNKMGANIIKQNNMIVVVGGNQLKGAKIDGKDLRGGASLLIAALCAEGESILTGLKFINRGYENIVNKCQKLGAEIKS